MNKKFIKVLKILTAIAVVAILIAIIIYMIPIFENLKSPEGRIEFKNKIQSTGFKGMMLLFALQLAQIILIFIPGEPIEIVAGMCYGAIGGTLFIIVSCLIISTSIFMLVRTLGEKFAYEFSDKEKVSKIVNSKLFKNPKKIEMIMIILFLIPGTPKDLLVYACGLLPIKTSSFILISTFARIPSIISSTLIGSKIIKGNPMVGIGIYIAIIIAVIVVVFIYNKFDKDKTTEEAIKQLR